VSCPIGSQAPIASVRCASLGRCPVRVASGDVRQGSYW
jgi:hypothetical protein